MKQRLKPDHLRELLSYDPFTGLLTWRFRDRSWFASLQAFSRWNNQFAGKAAFTSVDADGYCRGKILDETYKAHQVIWAICFGYYPKLVDHKDGNRTNNRLPNLRDATHTDNSRNAAISTNNSSGVTGVNWHPCGKWNARINHEGRRIDLGFYNNFDDAVAVRRSAEIIFGYHPNHGKR